MAKILISSLGTGQKREDEYQKATYQIDKMTYTTSFIADALSQHLKIDKLFLVGTNKSIWDEAYKAFGGDDDGYHMDLYEKKDRGLITQEDLLVFNETVSKKLRADGSKASVIKFGINDDELWEIFERYLEIADSIEDGDELYLDITHSFRSLSMMSLVMSQFSASISDKQFQLKGVYYGMLEYQGETEDKIAPIVNLNILFELQEWIKAIDAIKKYSDFDPLVEILNKEDIEVKVDNVFTELNNAIDIANMAAIQKFVQNASKKIRAIASSENRIIKLLSAEVIKLVDELNHDRMSDFQYALAKWFYKNKNYALSYMALAEAIVTKTCEYKGYHETSEEGRKEAKSHIDAPYGAYYSATKKVNGTLVTNEGSISDIRNNIAHQLNARSDTTKRDIEKLKFFIDEFESYFKKERAQ